MSVPSNQFYELNQLRPKGSSCGEVTSIDLFVTEHDSCSTYFITASKRKSIHVPPSSNAYWNWMNLRAELTAFASRKGYERKTRNALYAALNDAVRFTHKFSCIEHYTDEVEDATQYFSIYLTIGAEVPDVGAVVRASVRLPELTSSGLPDSIFEGNWVM